jgi:hypothetical protein
MKLPSMRSDTMPQSNIPFSTIRDSETFDTFVTANAIGIEPWLLGGAVLFRRFEQVVQLLAQEADDAVATHSSHRTEYDQSLLSLAFCGPLPVDLRVVNALIATPTALADLERGDFFQRRALHHAALRHYDSDEEASAAVRLLVDAGADPSAVDHSDLTPLALTHSIGVARLLARAGATGGSNLFKMAARDDNAELIGVLARDAGGDVNRERGDHSALTSAATHGSMNATAALLVLGAEKQIHGEPIDENAPTSYQDMHGRTVHIPRVMRCDVHNRIAGVLIAGGVRRGIEMWLDGRHRLDAEIKHGHHLLAHWRGRLIVDRVVDVCFGLAALELPALVMLEIVDFACPFMYLLSISYKYSVVSRAKVSPNWK